jgi:predicted  nucleic acid-binding Zn-ribbon protein
VSGENFPRDAELAAARANLQQLETEVDALNHGRENAARRVLVLEAEVDELAQRVRGREQALDQDQGEIAKQRERLTGCIFHKQRPPDCSFGKWEVIGKWRVYT